MKTQFLPFQQAVDRLCGTPQDRGRTIACAIAVALASAAQLPSSPVESTQEFFNATVCTELQQFLGEFNENLVFDCAVAITLARQVWMTRYRAVHPPEAFNVLSQCTFFETLFGVPATIAPDDVAFFNANKNPILHLAGVAGVILAGLKKHG